MEIEVALLGQVGLRTADGGVVVVPSPTQRRLLAVLALQRGRVVRSEHLAEVLGLSAGALRKAVSRVRALVGEGALRTTPVGYVLDVAVDADRFTAALRAGPGDRIAALEGALALWQGDALDEFAAEAWAQGDAIALDELRAAAVEELAELLIDADRGTEAVATLERQIARRPLADRPRLLLMRALAATGRRTEALRRYQSYRTLLGESVGTEPSVELRTVERRIALGWDGTAAGGERPAPAATRPVATGARGELPIPATRWVGSSGRITELAAGIAVERIVTLTGPGGVGKTRTAIEVAHAAAETFADGVWLIELAAVADPEAVAEAVASLVGASRQPGRTVAESIVDRLRGRSLLLVIDNCEHVIGAVAEVVAAVVAACPTVTVLATSREPLRVRGERVVVIPPLPIADGIELFEERALAADDTLRFTEEDRVAIATICVHLDGLPLAVELAAARARSLAPVDLVARLDDRLGLLGASRDGLDHQRTLRATVEWSYQLLSSEERLLFERVSVFAGSFDLLAVEAVCGSDPFGPADVGELLAALVDKSMIVVDRSGAQGRYRLLETLRQMGEELLARRRQAAAVGFRHLTHYVAVAERAEADWFSPRQLAADIVYDSEWDNLRAAHAFALATHDRRHLARLLDATIAHSHHRMRTEHAAWSHAAVALGSPEDPVATTVVGWAAWWAMIAGDHDRSEALARSIIERAEGVDPSDAGVAVCRAVALFTAWTTGRRDEVVDEVVRLEATLDALAPWPECVARRALFPFSVGAQWEAVAARIATITEGIGAPALVASARFYQATAKLYAGPEPDPAAAVVLHEEGIALARAAGAELSECQHLQGLLDAKVALDAPDVGAVCVEALRRLHDLRYWLYLWRVVDSAALLLARSGATDEAALVLGHLDAHAPPWRNEPRRTTRAVLAAAAEPATPDRTTVGAALDREEVVRIATDSLATLVPIPG